ncbi:hypothetical protein PAST3_07399 [Cutibacterium acnes HL201PA1]|jgi:hypothetical protein|nr:hypothetical protein PAST3_07399 [Cutibacterium acnes HL201PA1]
MITERAVDINDSVHISPEDLEDWNNLTEQERENLASETP